MDYEDAVNEINKDYEAAKELGLESVNVNIECLKPIAAYCNRCDLFMESLDDIRNELDKVIEYEAPMGQMTQAKWDKLYKYSIEPFLDRY